MARSRTNAVVTVGVLVFACAVTSAITTAFVLSDGRKTIAQDGDVVVTYQRDGTLRIVVPSTQGSQIVYEVRDFYGDLSEPEIHRSNDDIQVTCGEYAVKVSPKPVTIIYPRRFTSP